MHVSLAIVEVFLETMSKSFNELISDGTNVKRPKY